MWSLLARLVGTNSSNAPIRFFLRALPCSRQTDIVIDGFTGLWEVLILPLLTTHMTLTFLSAGIEKFAFNDEA